MVHQCSLAVYCAPSNRGDVTIRRRKENAPTSTSLLRRGPGEPGRFSQAHEGVVYGCCVPALTRFTNPHCPGPPRLTRTSAITRRQKFLNRSFSVKTGAASRDKSRGGTKWCPARVCDPTAIATAGLHRSALVSGTRRVAAAIATAGLQLLLPPSSMFNRPHRSTTSFCTFVARPYATRTTGTPSFGRGGEPSPEFEAETRRASTSL